MIIKIRCYDNMPPSSQEPLNHAINRNREFCFNTMSMTLILMENVDGGITIM